jgi:hypothetical protein
MIDCMACGLYLNNADIKNRYVENEIVSMGEEAKNLDIKRDQARRQWLTAAIVATQEAEIRRISV